jgi:o-succinylbenzoate synthase
MLKFLKYQIPFKTPFRIAGNEFSTRKGIIMVFSDGKVEAYGEVAPLPGFSDESLSQVEAVLKMNRDHLDRSIQSGQARQVLKVLDQVHQFPSLAFGIDTLLHDYESKKTNKPLVEYLFGDDFHDIECNGTISISSEKKTFESAAEFVEKGFKTLKLKVGTDFEKELRILTSLRKKFPAIAIRIDANQAWSESEAEHNLNQLEPLKIEYCEQPVSSNDIRSLIRIKDKVSIPIAADESLRNKDMITEVCEQQAADFLILKPNLIGTFKDIFVTNELANTHNIEAVFTTSLETSVSIAAIAALAAGLSNKKSAQGLSTGNLFLNGLKGNSWLGGSGIKFNNSTGLGISLHLEGLTEI